MRENWKDAFSFNHKERKGVAVLLSGIVLVIILDQVWPIVLPPKELDITVITIPQHDSVVQNKFEPEKTLKNGENMTFPIFRFDLNTVSESELQEMGFKAYQIKMLLNYREAGGVFYSKQDFQKLYFVNDSIYNRFEKVISIEKTQKKVDSVPTDNKRAESASVIRKVDRVTVPSKKKPTFTVALNQSDTSEWKRFYGIGSGYSNRIVNYRKKLGGFIRKEQLLEVYGIDSVLYQRIEPQLEVDLSFVKKMNLNTVSTTRLSRHPYITWNMARLITDSRVQDGLFEDTEDLLTRDLLNEVLYIKIVGYLEVY